jgi:hypothetical protein
VEQKTLIIEPKETKNPNAKTRSFQAELLAYVTDTNAAIAATFNLGRAIYERLVS